MTADQILRREVLAWLLEFAERGCPVYARQAAREREKLGAAHGCAAMFRGLADRFDVEWSAKKAQMEIHP